MALHLRTAPRKARDSKLKRGGRRQDRCALRWRAPPALSAQRELSPAPPKGLPQTPRPPAPRELDEFDRPQRGRDTVTARRGRGEYPGEGGFAGCRQYLRQAHAGGSRNAGTMGLAESAPRSRSSPELRQRELPLTKYLDGNTGTFRSKGNTRNQTPNVPGEWKGYTAAIGNKVVSR